MDCEQIVRWYFTGEKAEAFWILAAGVASLVAAIVLWFVAREPFARGLAMALLVIAGLGLSVGGTVYFRSDAQSQQLIEQQRSHPSQFAAEEGPRIRQVVGSFAQYRIGYAVAVLLALFFVFVMGKPSQRWASRSIFSPSGAQSSTCRRCRPWGPCRAEPPGPHPDHSYLAGVWLRLMMQRINTRD